LSDALLISPGAGPDVAADTLGNINVVWQDPTLGIMYAQVGPDGTITVPATSMYASHGDGFPHIAVDSAGDAHIVATTTGFGGLIYLKVSGGQRVTLNAFYIEPTSADDINDSSPSITINPVTQLPVVVAEVQSDLLEWDGDIWDPELVPVYSTFIASVALDDGGNPVAGSIFEAWYYLDTEAPQFDVSYPSVAVDNSGVTHVVWLYQDPDLTGLTVAYANPAWTYYVEIAEKSNVSGLEGRPIITRGYDGNLDIVWSTTDDSVVWTQINPGGLITVDNATVSQPEAKPTWPVLASGPGQLVCSWTDGREGANSQIYARSLLNSVPECDVSQSPGAASLGAVAIDSSGYTAYVWQDARTGSAQLYYRRTAIAITPLRVGFSQADPTTPADVNTSIVPQADASLLGGGQVALGKGVVADGVTPVLFMITGTPGTYSLQIETSNGNYANGSLADDLFVLNGNQWVRATSITIPPGAAGDAGTNFAYLPGLNWSDFSDVDTSVNEVDAVLSLNGGGNQIANASFAIRPVPIVLVHGVAGTAASWTAQFMHALTLNVPPDFVQAITYGKGLSPWPHFWPSETDTLPVLAREVDEQLHAVEQQLGGDWDFTRYDVVGQSQGGVLLRMLCQVAGSSDLAPFTGDTAAVVSSQNFYRGRFRRVVTIGSPHNGSLLAYYINQLSLSVIDWEQELSLVNFCAFPCLQKFDPSQWQIEFINSPDFPVDQRVPFHCIQSTIAGGKAPSADSAQNPLIYNLLGLQNPLPYYNGLTRGQILIPLGSDGAVDLVSQGGGPGTASGEDFTEISHCDPEWIFSVPPLSYETASASVGARVANLLSGPSTAFGAFILPPIITQNAKDIYNSVIPSVQTIAGALQAKWALDNSTNVYLSFTVPTNCPILGTIEWEALVYDSAGIETNGLWWSVDTNNSQLMTLSVSNGVAGQVVVSAEYMATNGDLVFAEPLVVLSRPPSPGATLTNIEIAPSSISLDVGSSILTQILGDYSDGSQSLLYVPPRQAIYSSSNPAVVAVDTNGYVTLLAGASATIQATYSGFAAQGKVSANVPFILIAPKDETLPNGSTAALTVLAAGSGPVSFQWAFNSSNLVDNAQISGSRSNVLTIVGLGLANSGIYEVTVSAPSGSTNLLATLTVSPATNQPPSGSLPPLRASLAVGTNLVFLFTGVAGSNYVLQSTFSLLPPITWWPVLTNTVDTGGNWSVTQTNVAAFPAQFFRIAAP